MIDLDTLRKTKGYVLAIVNESTGEYRPVSDDVVQVIRCKDCKHHHYDGHGIPYCDRNNYGYGWTDDDFCSYPERKDEYVTLRHENIHFIDEDAENAFYESLVEEILEDDWDD